MNVSAIGRVLFAAVLIAYGSATADVYYVSTNSLPDGPGTAWSNAFHTIQAAVDAADPYDTVLVTNGLYATGSVVPTGQAVKTRVYITSNVTVRSLNGPSNTIIEGAGPSGADAIRCVTAQGNTMLAGFTLTNGFTRHNTTLYSDSNNGGGIHAAASATISNCIIVDCSAHEYGGGACGGALYDCELEGNTSALGGGAYTSVLHRCVLRFNSALQGGGAVECSAFGCVFQGNQAEGDGGGAREGMLESCLLYENEAGDVGGGTDNALLRNCTVVDNSATNDGGGVQGTECYNCIVYANTAERFGSNWWSSTFTECSTLPLPAGSGNITNDPQFADSTIDNYRLSRTSPCIDEAADTNVSFATDLVGNPRIMGAAVDMGAYESIPNHYVATNGAHVSPFTTWANAATSIQAAVDIALEGATVLVTNGWYALDGAVIPGHSVSNRVCVTQAVTVASVKGPAYTTIAATGSPDADPMRCAWLSEGAVLCGFTLTNGCAYTNLNASVNHRGGGVYGTNAVVSNCCITTCRATDGGGIYGASAVRCRLRGNSAGSGGGISHGSLDNCLVVENNAESFGGGVRISSVTNCTITANSAGLGAGGLQICYAVNSIIWSNTAPFEPNDNASTLEYCCRWPDRAGPGNISEDPVFVDPVSGDYRLHYTSPCLDAGSNDRVTSVLDVDGITRIIGPSVDMGAYERVSIQYVSVDGAHEPPYDTWDRAATNIQDAVDTVAPGDTVWVSNGSYTVGSRVTPSHILPNRLVITNGAIVAGVNGPETTSIVGAGPNGSSAVRCAYLSGGSTLQGFTLRSGHTFTSSGDTVYDRSGGGVFMASAADCIRQCVVRDCEASHLGGAVYANGGRLESCLVRDNACSGWVGGVHKGHLVNCTVVQNSAGNNAGGTFSGTLRNSIVVSNSVGGDFPNCEGGDVQYCCTVPLPGSGEGNITNAPAFVDSGADDYRLTRSSPCVDAGMNGAASWSDDLSGLPRQAGPRVDMGAYEFAYVRYVWQDGGHRPPFVRWPDAATNIQAAIDLCDPEDMVRVTNGVYDLDVVETPGLSTASRIAITQNIHVCSVNGPEHTAIVGKESNPHIRCVYMTDGRLSGFTITNGSASSPDGGSGGGILAESGLVSNCLITACNFVAYGSGMRGGTARNCTFRNNHARTGGGAYDVDCYDCLFDGNYVYGGRGGGACSSRLDRCTLLANQALDGGGAYGCKLDSCMVVSNAVTDEGGGLFGGSALNCLVLYNRSEQRGAGAYNTWLTNCTVCLNAAEMIGGGVYGPAEAYNSIVYDNSAPSQPNWSCKLTASCSTPMNYGVGNITNAPCFVDAEALDFHMWSDSACINRGSNACAGSSLDMDAFPRIMGGRVDIGCYEQSRRRGMAAPEVTRTEHVPPGWTWRLAADGTNVWIAGPKASSTLVAWTESSLPEVTNGIEQTYAGTTWSNAVGLASLAEGDRRTRIYVTRDAGGSERSAEQTTLEIVRTDQIPLVDIATNTYTVGYPTTSVTWSVTCNDHVVSPLWVTNARNAYVDTFLSDETETCPIQIDAGVNTVGVYGTNIYGCMSGNRRTVHRRPIEAFAAVNGAHRYPFADWDTAATGIQQAVDAVWPGGTVRLSNGVYRLNSHVLLTNAVTVQSTGNRAAVIDGCGTTRCFNVQHTNGVLADLTLTNGHSVSGSGGGAILAGGVVSNCLITDCMAGDDGGGLYVENGTVVTSTIRECAAGVQGGGIYADHGQIFDCLLAGNSAGQSGGGLFLEHDAAERCVLRDNTAQQDGGGVAVVGDLEQCIVTNNHAMETGGGIWLWDDATAQRCVARDNRADGDGGGLYIKFSGVATNCLIEGNVSGGDGGGAWITTAGAPPMKLNSCTVVDNIASNLGGGIYDGIAENCIIYDNAADAGNDNVDSVDCTYCCTPSLPASGIGNFTNNPAFVNPLARNYRLRYGSACIDSLDDSGLMPDNDIDGCERPVDGDGGAAHADAGCYEYDPETANSNADGIPDWWYLSYSMDPCISTNAEANPDSDPFTTGDEYIADTDPTNSLDWFHIVSLSNVPPVTLYFESSSNRVYAMRCCTNLCEGDWTNVPGAGPRLGCGTADWFDDTNAPSCGIFYRVWVDLP